MSQQELFRSTDIFSFDVLKEGMHVRLRCKCECFIEKIHQDSFGNDRWIRVMYTLKGCTSEGSLEPMYAIPGFSSMDVFHQDSFPAILPMMTVEPPKWYPSLAEGPKAVMKSMILLHVCTPEGILVMGVPGNACNMDPYSAASYLRREVGDNVSVKVVEYGPEGFEGDIKKAISSASQGADFSVDKRNSEALRDWVFHRLGKSVRGEEIECSKDVPLPKEEVVSILREAQLKKIWRANTVRIQTSDGQVAVLTPDGKIV